LPSHLLDLCDGEKSNETPYEAALISILVGQLPQLRQHCFVYPQFQLPREIVGRRQENSRPLPGPKTDKAPVIDGKLDDEVWKKAAVADGFWISEQQRWPSEKTEVLILVDKDYARSIS